MSGTAFLEEIVTWDDEKRAEKVEEALPRLIGFFENYRSYDEAIGVLQIVCQSFVPVVQQDQLEDKVFCRLSLQVCQLLNAVLEDVHEAASEAQTSDVEQLMVLLQHVVNVAQCMEECVRHVAAMADLHTCHVRSLISCSFHVLKGSYSHCQESGSLYGDLLPTLSDSLSLIFRKAHSLQMVVLNLLDRVVTPLPLADHTLQDIAQVCADLFTLCRVVASLDHKLTISLWKALSRLAGPQAEVLHNHIDLSGMVMYLCDEVRTGTTQLLHSTGHLADAQNEQSLSQGDEKVFQKSLRILNFQIKVLVAIVRDFADYLGDCVTGLHKLLLCMNSVLPPNLSAPRLQGKHEEGLRQSVCCAAQPLLSYLLNQQAFCSSVLNTGDTDSNTDLAHLLLLVMVMHGVTQASVNVASMWLQVSQSDDKLGSSLLSAVLTALHKCHTEVCLPVYLPGPPYEGKPSRSISLYQYVVEHTSAFIASCPARLFHIIEKSLLGALLGLNPISSQAAMDCWCFLARYGTADLCWHHTQQIMWLVMHVRGAAPHSAAHMRPLTTLLARLVKFLTPQHQAELVSQLPPANHLDVWAEVGVQVFSDSVTSDLCGSLLPACLNAMSSFCRSSSSSSSSLSQAAAVIPAMQCLHKLAQQLTAQQGALLLDMVRAMWDSALPVLSALLLGSNPDCRVRGAYLSTLLVLTCDVVDHLDVKMVLQIVVLAQTILKDAASRELNLAVLQLMRSLGRVKLPPSVEQGQILRKVSNIFAAALMHPDAVVQFAALESFTRFAEHTPYEAVVPECLAQHQGLQETVAAYLQKTALATGSQFDTVRYLQHEQLEVQTRTIKTRVPEQCEPSEPGSKRQKREYSRDADSLQTSHQKVLEELEQATEKLEKLHADGPLPDCIRTQGRSIVQRLSACLENR